MTDKPKGTFSKLEKVVPDDDEEALEGAPKLETPEQPADPPKTRESVSDRLGISDQSDELVISLVADVDDALIAHPKAVFVPAVVVDGGTASPRAARPPTRGPAPVSTPANDYGVGSPAGARPNTFES